MSCGVLRNCTFQGSSENEGIVSSLDHREFCNWGELPSIGICIYVYMYVFIYIYIYEVIYISTVYYILCLCTY